METAQIWVDPLGDPTTPPDELGTGDESWAEDLRRDAEGGEQDWVGWATDRMIPAAQAAYRVAGVASAIVLRVPIDRAWELWATEPDEVRPVVAAVLPLVPRTPFARFIIGRLPGAAALVQGAGLAIDRVRATRDLRNEEPDDDRIDRPASPPAGTRFGVGSIPRPQPDGPGDGPRGVHGLDDDERSMEVARSNGRAPDGTITDPALLRRYLGGVGPAG